MKIKNSSFPDFVADWENERVASVLYSQQGSYYVIIVRLPCELICKRGMGEDSDSGATEGQQASAWLGMC